MCTGPGQCQPRALSRQALTRWGALGCSDRLLRLVRRVSPPTAQRLRALAGGYGGLGCAAFAALLSQVWGMHSSSQPCWLRQMPCGGASQYLGTLMMLGTALSTDMHAPA